MPLSMIGEGETATITRIGGKEETRRFLENLGFVVGAIVTVISKTGGNVIVNIKDDDETPTAQLKEPRTLDHDQTRTDQQTTIKS